jgi:hypothetical protein
MWWFYMRLGRKKMSDVLFKVNFENAYDNVNWAFLYNVMVKKRFSQG